MKFCDITIAYNEKSGGIRTYIDEKRRYLVEHTPHEHVLVIPAEEDGVEVDGRLTTVKIAGPLLPNQTDYRFFLTPGKVKEALAAQQPDIVELGSYYTEPWAAFSYRRRRREAGARCVLGGYFHTDVADAYVAAPLRAAGHAWLNDTSDALNAVVETIADVAAAGAEQYIRYIFRHCDLALAATPAQAKRLHEYGVEEVKIAPMGVDLNLFNPSRRDQAVRAAHGAGRDTLVLMYAGRLSTEKHVTTLIDAANLIPQRLRPLLWLAGDGPLREEIAAAVEHSPRVRLLPYETDRLHLATLLASADVYVTAGPHETFGLSVIEAQASGLPVVGVDAGALRERVSPSLGRLVPVDDVPAMAEAVRQVANEREAMGRRARAHVERHFGWGPALDQLLAHYERAVAQASVSQPAPQLA